jgi:hypothetical protein
LPVAPDVAPVFRTRDGEAVDPVPYLVVTALAFLGCVSFLPVYLRSLGVALPTALGVAGVVFVGLATAAYYRMVWTARPALRGEVPPGHRLRRVLYAALVVVAVLVGLTLALAAR